MSSDDKLNTEQVARQVAYWLDLADYDMTVARTVLVNGHLLYVGFMCHQVVEKGLKGLYVIAVHETPPYSHALVKLAKLSNTYDELRSDGTIEYRSQVSRTEKGGATILDRGTLSGVDTGHRKITAMDKSEVRQRVEEYAKLVAKEFPRCEILLFGSYVTGQPREDSDIDVAVVVPSFEGDFLTMAARLHHLRNDIEPMIEPHLLSQRNDESGFLREIQRTGEVIYRAA